MNDAPDREEAVDLRQYIRPVWRRKWLILAIVVVLAGGTYAYYERKPKQYRATTQVFIRASELETALFGSDAAIGDDRTTSNQATLLQSRGVAREVARRLRRRDPDALLGMLDVRTTEGKDFLTLSAISTNPAFAASVVNGFARSFISLRTRRARGELDRALRAAQRELRATPRSATNDDTRRALQDQVRRLEISRSLPAAGAEQLDSARPPGAPFAPRVVRNTVFAGFVGLFLGICLAFGLERLNRRLTTVEDVERIFDEPVLSVVPQGDAAHSRDGQPVLAEDFKEAFRSLRINLELASLEQPLRSLLVVSALPGEGKSTVVRNLALVYAEAGLRVAVVETDVRKPSVARGFGLPASPGLTEVLAGVVALEDAMRPLDMSAGLRPMHPGAKVSGNGAVVGDVVEGGVTVLPSGPEPPNPPALLAAPAVAELIQRLEQDFDIVLLDSAPLIAVSDAVPLLSVADGTIVVSRLGVTTREAATRFEKLFVRVPNARQLGVVANAVPREELMGGTYVFYGYGPAERRAKLRS
jgi:Mrp family chromosome partitioning ATPase/capsular polysaccharide biosynthesis protein